jgi:hypothetical protein
MRKIGMPLAHRGVVATGKQPNGHAPLRECITSGFGVATCEDWCVLQEIGLPGQKSGAL